MSLGDRSDEAFAKVAERFPIGPDTPTHTRPDGVVVNMSREAMLARVEAIRRVLVETFT